MVPPEDSDALPPAELKALVGALLGKVAELERTVAAQREEIARLKGLKGRPPIKPSGMEQASEPKSPRGSHGRRRRRGAVVPRVAVEERVIRAAVPPGSRFRGHQDFLVQDLVLRTEAVRYRRERWLTPEGRLVVAPLPGGVDGHFGPELRRFVLAQYHQGQATVPRLVAQLRAVGIAKRQVVRLLLQGQRRFLDESRDVLRAGLASAAWVTVDDTGARHRAANGSCTQVGNDHFAWFGTTASRSRLNFLELLRAGHVDYVVNAEALAYMRERALDRLLERLHVNKPELLRVLERPEIPLHTNGSENDIRAQVTRRKVSGGTRSDLGRDCRDAFLGLAKTCAKLGISFWDYLGDRLGITGQDAIPYLPDLVRERCRPA